MSLPAGLSMMSLPDESAVASLPTSGFAPDIRIDLVSADDWPPRMALTTPSTCAGRLSVCSDDVYGHVASDAPGTRPAASARPKLMRFKIAPVFIQASPRSGQPSGV